MVTRNIKYFGQLHYFIRMIIVMHLNRISYLQREVQLCLVFYYFMFIYSINLQEQSNV